MQSGPPKLQVLRLPCSLTIAALSRLDPNSKQPDTWSSGSTMPNKGLSSENDDLGTGLGRLGSALLPVLPTWETNCGIVTIELEVTSAGKTKSTGTSSPNLLFSLSIFAERRVASEGISKEGSTDGLLSVKEFDFELWRKHSAEVLVVTISWRGDAGMVSRAGLTDATVDGGPCITAFDVSLSNGGGFRVGFRARHTSVELTVPV